MDHFRSSSPTRCAYRPRGHWLYSCVHVSISSTAVHPGTNAPVNDAISRMLGALTEGVLKVSRGCSAAKYRPHAGKHIEYAYNVRSRKRPVHQSLRPSCFAASCERVASEQVVPLVVSGVDVRGQMRRYHQGRYRHGWATALAINAYSLRVFQSGAKGRLSKRRAQDSAKSNITGYLLAAARYFYVVIKGTPSDRSWYRTPTYSANHTNILSPVRSSMMHPSIRGHRTRAAQPLSYSRPEECGAQKERPFSYRTNEKETACKLGGWHRSPTL